MASIGKIQDPKHGELANLSVRLASDLPVQSSLSKLRFAFRIQIQVGSVLFQDLDDRPAFYKGVRQNTEAARNGDRPPSVWYSGNWPWGVLMKASHGQIESWRTELSLVVAIRGESNRAIGIAGIL